MIPFSGLSQPGLTPVDLLDKSTIILTRDQGIEVLHIMDDRDWLSWDNLELKRLLTSQYGTLTLTETALSQCLSAVEVKNEETLTKDVALAAYRNDYGELNEQLIKTQKRAGRRTWFIVIVGVTGLIVGVALAK